VISWFPFPFRNLCNDPNASGDETTDPYRSTESKSKHNHWSRIIINWPVIGRLIVRSIITDRPVITVIVPTALIITVVAIVSMIVLFAPRLRGGRQQSER
jgi:hypothetical protein